ncbi:hypothetical protein GQ53DRAFT_825514 [Thozetella sp. PMI_491]|nr:hypothetical protein GQ53DRAFT_825514 [Thozetella sp. PMI_491]
MKVLAAWGGLLLSTTSHFEQIWKDTGSGASRDGGFWHPVSENIFRPVGSVGVNHYGDINGQYWSLLVGQEGGAATAVVPPVDYVPIYNDKGSGASQDGSFWRPVCPANFASLGDVVQRGYTKPSTDKVWCVRRDLVGPARYAASVWNDQGSGAAEDGSMWPIETDAGGTPGADIGVTISPFRANQGYSTPPDSLALAIIQSE